MATFVVDASVTLAWCFADEAIAWTDGLLDRLRAGDNIAVPAHWPTEVSNGLLMAVRRQRIQPDQPNLFWDELAVLPIDVESALSPYQAKGRSRFESAIRTDRIRRGLFGVGKTQGYPPGDSGFSFIGCSRTSGR